MEATVEQLILSELQETRKDLKEFRTEVSDWHTEMEGRMKEVEVKARDISGNGQPGRMKDAEHRITILERIVWYAGGALVAAEAFVGIFLKWGHK